MISNKIKPQDIKLKNRTILLIFPRVTSSGIFIANTVDKDSSSNEWTEVYAVGKDCTDTKPGDLVMVNYANRPLWKYDKDVYEWDEEFDLIQMFEHDIFAYYEPE